MRLSISMKILIMVIILAVSQLVLIGVLAKESEKSLAKEAENRIEIQKQQVDIQAKDYRNLIDAMHIFTGNNIQTNLEVARTQLKKECGNYVESKGTYLECENGYIIEDTINDNSLVKSIKNIVRGHSSVFIDLGEGKAKKISTTVTEGMYVYGYMAEESMYNKVIKDGNSFVKFTKIKGVYKTKACDPLKNKEGKVVGSLCVGIPEKPTLDQIKEKVKSYSFGSDGKVYLIDTYPEREGQVLAHPDFSEGTDLSEKPYIKEMLEKKEGIVQYEVDGVKKIAAYTYYEPYDMIIVAENTLLEEQNIGSGKIISLSLALLVVSVIGALLFSRTITVPIKKLKNAADEATSGNFNVKIPLSKISDEISDLAASVEMLIVAFKSKLKGKK